MALNADDHATLLHLPISPLAATQLIDLAQDLASLSDTAEKDV